MNNWLVWLLSFILPRRKWYRNYYLRSRHWRETRKNKIKKHDYWCDCCSRIAKIGTIQQWRLDVHHRYYYRNGKSILWHERPEDLQVLCRTCHNKEHERK